MMRTVVFLIIILLLSENNDPKESDRNHIHVEI